MSVGLLDFEEWLPGKGRMELRMHSFLSLFLSFLLSFWTDVIRFDEG